MVASLHGAYPMRVNLIHNPGAGEEDHGPRELIAAIERAGHRVDHASTDDPDWRDGLEGPADLVVAAGGDGTVRTVFIAMAKHGCRTPVTVLPLGSANNVARVLGLAGRDAGELAREWERARPRRYAVGELRTPHGPLQCVESAGGGVFGAVLERAAQESEPTGERKRLRGLELLAEAVAAAPAVHWQLELDGRDLSGDYIAVEALNGREFGPNLALAPAARAGDGLIDLVLVGPGERAALAALVAAHEGSGGDAAPAPPTVRGRRLLLRAPRGEPFHVDDDLHAAPSGELSYDRLAVEVLIPPPARPVDRR